MENCVEVPNRNIPPYKSFTNTFNIFYVMSANQDGSMIAAGDFDGNILFYHNFQQTWCLNAHKKYVITIKIALNNKYLASGSADNTIKLIELQNGSIKNTITLNYHSAYIMKVDFSLDSLYLSSASSDKCVILYNINTGQKKTLQFKQSITFVQFISKNKIAIGGSHIFLDFYYFPNLRKIYCHPDYLKQVTFSITQSSNLYLCCSYPYTNIELRNCAKFKIIRKFLNERNHIMNLCIKNNKAVVTLDSRIEIWDWMIGKLDCVINSSTSTGCSEITNDGQYLIAISRMNIKVWQQKQLQ